MAIERTSRPAKAVEKAAAAKAKPKRAEVSWEGDSRKTLKSWPAAIRGDFGVSLDLMQLGLPATLDVRKMDSVGEGVFELKTEDQAAWYRLMYLARINDVIYVLDCFKKDTRKTEKKDLERTAKRLKEVRQKLMEELQDAKKSKSHHNRKRT